MRCLVIAGVFPPAGGGGALRLSKMLQHLPGLGCEVEVIAPRGRSGWFEDPALLESVRQLPIARTGLPSPRLFSRLRRRVKDPLQGSPGPLASAARLAKLGRDRLLLPDELLPWAAAALLTAAGRMRRRAYDWLLTASFPYSAHLVGLALAGRGGARWLADFADPWAGHPFRAQDSGLRRHVDSWLEARVLERADRITVATPGMRRLLTERGWPPERALVLTNAWDVADFGGAAPAVDGELLFVGSFDARLTPPDPLLAALARARARAPGRLPRLRIMGGADLESAARLRQRLPELGEGAVRFDGYASHAEAVRAMRQAAALLLSVAPGAHWHMTAKVIEYLASGRPIIAAVPPGDCKELLSRSGGAVTFSPEDVDGIAAALLAASDGSLRVPAVDRAELARYESRAVAERLVGIMAT